MSMLRVLKVAIPTRLFVKMVPPSFVPPSVSRATVVGEPVAKGTNLALPLAVRSLLLANPPEWSMTTGLLPPPIRTLSTLEKADVVVALKACTR